MTVMETKTDSYIDIRKKDIDKYIDRESRRLKEYGEGKKIR